jgi:hypothetical protein
MSPKFYQPVLILLSALLVLALLVQPIAAQAAAPRATQAAQVQTDLLNEDFSDNSAGWTLGTEWQIGSATASPPPAFGNPDPGADHTPTGDNGVAGVLIGGNTSTILHPYYYLTSPVINANFPGAVTLEFYRWLNSDYTPYMNNQVEVWDGSAWVAIWQSGGSPGITDNAWNLQTYDLTPYKNAALQVRFGYTIGQAGVYIVSSWNIDDVRIFTPNTAPTANDEPYSLSEDNQVDVPAPGVLSNDSDPESDPLTAVLDSGPTNGSLDFNPDGSFIYTPTLNYYGGDSFTYYAFDGQANSNIATVYLLISPVNDAPVAVADAYTTTEDTPLEIAAPGLLANDSDTEGQPLTAELVTFAEQGGIVIVLDGAFVYTPDPDYNGLDTFTYRANDGQLDSNVVTVTLTVNPVNDAPLVDAGADQAATEGQSVSFSGNFADPGLLLDIVTASAVTWDFGDGASMTGTLTPTHAYADDSLYTTVTLVVTDELGAVGSDWLVVTVANVAPVLAPLADASLNLGDPFTLALTFSDPGLLDAHTVVIAWGDGLTETLELAPGLLSLDLSHTYAAEGSFPVTITVTDEDGDIGSAAFTVNVARTSFFIHLPVILK